MSQDKLVIYTDGGSRGNPGPAGWGAYIETVDQGFSGFLGTATNNDAEYAAIENALQKAKALLGKERAKRTEIDMRMDSELAVRQLNHQYKLKEPRIQAAFIRVWNLMLDFKRVTFTHVPREKNRKADALANQAMDRGGGGERTLFA